MSTIYMGWKTRSIINTRAEKKIKPGILCLRGNIYKFYETEIVEF